MVPLSMQARVVKSFELLFHISGRFVHRRVQHTQKLFLSTHRAMVSITFAALLNL